MSSSELLLSNATNENRCDFSVAVFTVCSVNYLSKAVALCLSVLEHDILIKPVILLADTKREIYVNDSRINLVWAEDIGFPEYLNCAFKYNIIEFNTSLKPFAALYLLNKFERVIYLDPDTCVFSPLKPVHEALDKHSAVFTPHALSSFDGEGRPNNRDLLRFGTCNLGFFAVRRSSESNAMLLWWHERCQTECFYEPSLGMGVDQKWIDLVFSYFKNMEMIRDPGLNVAFWNLHERVISNSCGVWLVNDKHRLCFMHFSSFVESNVQAIADKQTRYHAGSRPDFVLAANVYLNFLSRARNLVSATDLVYGYSRFENGDVISSALRRFYAICAYPYIKNSANPFSTDGPVHKFAKEYRLISRVQVSTTHTNFKIQANYSLYHKVITIAFRLLLRLLGPDRYFNLMRYLAHFSSILNQTDVLRK